MASQKTSLRRKMNDLDDKTSAMCNLYNITTNQAAILQPARVGTEQYFIIYFSTISEVKDV